MQRKQGRFCSSFNIRLLLIGCTLQLLQQLCGMNAFMYYGPQIFTKLGISAFLFTAVVGVVNLIATVPAIITQDRWGRTNLLIISFSGMAACCFTLAFLGATALNDINVTQNVAAAASNATADDNDIPMIVKIIAVMAIFFFVGFFAFGAGPVVWTYCSEMFPAKTRARSVGVTTCANWLGNLFLAQMTPIMLSVSQG